MTKKTTKIVTTILGNLYENAILRVKKKDCISYVTPKQGNIFYILSKNDELNQNRER